MTLKTDGSSVTGGMWTTTQPMSQDKKIGLKACFHYGCALRCVASDSQR